MSFMSRYAGPLCWAAAIILLAIGNAAGLVAEQAAQTLLIVLPLFAVISAGRARPCSIGKAA